MFTGINVHETKRITLPSDPHPENPTYFTLGVLDSIVSGHIKDSASSANGERFDLFKAHREMVKFGLRGVENFPGVSFETEDIKIGKKTYKAVKDDVLAVIPESVINELAGLILRGMALSGDEAKN